MKKVIKSSYDSLTTDDMWNILLDNNIATEDELQLVTDICGDNEKTYYDILYARTGNRDFSDYTD